MRVWEDVFMGVWECVCMRVWEDVFMGVWECVCMGVWMCVHACVGGCVDVWMNDGEFCEWRFVR